MNMCTFCFGTKKVEVIEKPDNATQSLKDAKEKGKKIVLVDCPFCTD